MNLTSGKKISSSLAIASLYLLSSGVVSMLLLGSVALGMARGFFVGLGTFLFGSAVYVGFYFAVEMLTKKVKKVKE